MATPQPDQEQIHAESGDSEQISRLKRYDQRVDEWLTSLKDEAGQRSPEVLGALAAKAHDVADYLDKMAEKARSRNETSVPTYDSSAGDVARQGYREPDRGPEGGGSLQDQGT